MAKYPDLKSYIQANYVDLLVGEVQKFVDKSYDGNGFHSINVLSLCKHEIDNLLVKTLSCHDDIGPRIKVDIIVSADIVELGLGTKRYEANRKTRWFTIYIQAKRWKEESTVGRPLVQEFVGALTGHHASKGVFITTSKFSAGAIEFTKYLPQPVILIDGEKLVQLMIEYNVGVTTRQTYEVKRLDLDYFSEDE